MSRVRPSGDSYDSREGRTRGQLDDRAVRPQGLGPSRERGQARSKGCYWGPGHLPLGLVLRPRQQFERIDGRSVQQDLVMQVRRRRAARRANVADDFAALDLLANAHGVAREVTEARLDAETVRDQDRVAVVAVVGRRLDD